MQPQPTETIKRPWGIMLAGIAIMVAVTLPVLAWTLTAIEHRHAPTTFVGAAAVACLVSMIALMVAQLVRPAPRVDYTSQGLEIRPARFVSVITATMTLGLILAMTLGLVFYLTGNLDFHPTDRAGNRFAGRMVVLAFAVPFILIFPYLPAIRTWISGQRKPWDNYPAVLLAPAGVQIDRVGVAKFVPWERIGDVRMEKDRAARKLIIYRNDAPASIYTEKLPLLGGEWLIDTIRIYWANPQERWRLAAGGQLP